MEGKSKKFTTKTIQIEQNTRKSGEWDTVGVKFHKRESQSKPH